MGQQHQHRNLSMRALLRDTTANTIVIAAAAMLPLMAMVGGSVDAGRYYMAASRLQAACDAGVLAARRAMTTDAFTASHQNIARNFFDHNFTDGLYGSTGRTRQFTSNGSGVVNGTATAVMPATIMRAFGHETFNINVACSADINISNTDIMFVLDVTGSMAANDAGGGLTRIQALRTAVMNFYDTVRTSTSGAARVRFGAVPYAHNVNVGGVIPSVHMASTHTYQSRVFNNQVLSDQEEWIPRIIPRDLGSSDTNALRYNNNNNGSANNGDRNRCQNFSGRSYTMNGNETWTISNATYVLNAFTGGNSRRRAGCRANVRKTRTAYIYQPVTYNVNAFKTGGTVTTPTGTNGANVTHTWDGCIEEAQTVNTANLNPVPAGAFDLDINLIPANEAQRWKPSLPDAIWHRWQVAPLVTTDANIQRPAVGCPAPAFTLTDIQRPQLQNFVNSLQPSGNTYHDIGMIWGARLISPRGIFAANNATAPNGDPIGRHIVFMTDGELVPSSWIYGTYGVEPMDLRITTDASNGQMNDRHERRFQAACTAAKNENISVWVVAFGTRLSTSLRNCASPDRAYEATNSAQLEAAFQEIAQKIAALRLTS